MAEAVISKKNKNIKIVIIIAIILFIVAAGVSSYIIYSNSKGAKTNRILKLTEQYLADLDFEHAIAQMQLALDMNPGNEEITRRVYEYMKQSVSYAEDLVESGRYSEAEEIYDALLEIESDEELIKKIQQRVEENITELNNRRTGTYDEEYDNGVSENSETGNSIDSEEEHNYTWQPIGDLEGKEVRGLLYTERPYKANWDVFSNAPVDDRYFVIQNGDKFGLMNINGEWIIDPIYSTVNYAYTYYINSGYEYDDPSYTLENGNLRQISDYEYPEINGTDADPCIGWNEETNAFITYYAQALVIYDDPYYYNGTLACGKYTTDWFDYVYKKAVITNNQPVTDFIYDKATTFSDGLIAVCKDDKWGYVDSSGVEVIPCEYDAIRSSDLSYEYALQYSALNYPTYYSAENVELYLESWRDWFFAAACTEGYVVLSKDDQYALYSSSNEEIIPFGEYEELSEVVDGKLFAKKDGVWGILDLANY